MEPDSKAHQMFEQPSRRIGLSWFRQWMFTGGSCVLTKGRNFRDKRQDHSLWKKPLAAGALDRQPCAGHCIIMKKTKGRLLGCLQGLFEWGCEKVLYRFTVMASKIQ
ncbi:MAG: hypothetical protein IPH54_15665 [Rhodoferax sp.]|nr:hypothetical protein [Rhodoferax sp.]